MAEVSRRLADRVFAPGTSCPPPASGADRLVGRRMPDVGPRTVGAEATRMYELLSEGRFVLLPLAGEPRLRESVDAGWGPRVTAVAVDTYDGHADLAGVTVVPVRPDGHVARATRSTDGGARGEERVRALTAWAGATS
ncbi:hypothetical protein [Streptomyces sp. NPDC060275]|uniref:aromatic-ring hydroxylase C-terminal domain-containing protein n=1 Tax=Streptomyces sp. NPDC060275 TaxID=3347090 RepID=UPI0036649642